MPPARPWACEGLPTVSLVPGSGCPQGHDSALCVEVGKGWLVCGVPATQCVRLGGFPAPCPVWWLRQSPSGEQTPLCPLLGMSVKGAGVPGWMLGCTGWVPRGAGRGEAGVGEPGSRGLSRKAPGAGIGFCLAVPSLSIQR